jgi:hypothetical protein
MHDLEIPMNIEHRTHGPFPPFEEWCDDVLNPLDTHPWNFRTEDFYNEYRAKYAIAKMVRPMSILEVGVRFGYSARSFLMAAPNASYIGLDIDEPSWGPYEGVPRLWADTRLRSLYPRNDIWTKKTNTQKDPQRPNYADLVHIDGDHSFEGTMHDLTTFFPLCSRVMVVDDYLEIASVRAAVDTFCHQQADAIRMLVTSLRGSLLLVKDSE